MKKIVLSFVFLGVVLLIAVIIAVLINNDSPTKITTTGKVGLYQSPPNAKLHIINSNSFIFGSTQDSVFSNETYKTNSPKIIIYGQENRRLVAYAFMDTTTKKFNWVIRDSAEALKTLMILAEYNYRSVQ